MSMMEWVGRRPGPPLDVHSQPAMAGAACNQILSVCVMMFVHYVGFVEIRVDSVVASVGPAELLQVVDWAGHLGQAQGAREHARLRVVGGEGAVREAGRLVALARHSVQGREGALAGEILLVNSMHVAGPGVVQVQALAALRLVLTLAR